MAKVILISEITSIIKNSHRPRSAWDKGVKQWALDLLDGMDDKAEFSSLTSLLLEALSGSLDWKEYCYDDKGIISDYSIVEAFCTPTEKQRYISRLGALRAPNADETWMDVQVKAATQAWDLIERVAKFLQTI